MPIVPAHLTIYEIDEPNIVDHLAKQGTGPDDANDPYAGFHMDCVKLGTEDRWDRLWLVFAWAYYWLNVGGWAVELRGQQAFSSQIPPIGEVLAPT